MENHGMLAIETCRNKKGMSRGHHDMTAASQQGLTNEPVLLHQN